MWQCAYAKEPFDLRLFMLRSIRKWKWILVGILAGMILIGGGYYLKNVTFGGRIPYEVINKFYIEYAMDPDAGDRYSYFEWYTWDAWMKSDKLVPGMLDKLSVEMAAEEFVTYYNATLPSDMRIPYFTVIHPDKEIAAEISEVLAEAVIAFGESQKEIESVEWMDMTGPQLQVRDIRTARAVVLGAIVGLCVSLLGIALIGIVDERIYVPETFAYRYDIPMLGYVDEEGMVSAEVEANLNRLFGSLHEIGEINVAEAEALTDSVETLRAMDGNLLLVPAGQVIGKNIEYLLNQCKIQNITITAALLVEADSMLINQYRFGRIGQ